MDSQRPIPRPITCLDGGEDATGEDFFGQSGGQAGPPFGQASATRRHRDGSYDPPEHDRSGRCNGPTYLLLGLVGLIGALLGSLAAFSVMTP
ncbi:MAG: hypothetical protein PHT12_03515 [Patescibacteria group bacterium]|nr:hypothetical protein [Patescibacteria group bacterium]